jgi:hypothetical protein
LIRLFPRPAVIVLVLAPIETSELKPTYFVSGALGANVLTFAICHVTDCQKGFTAVKTWAVHGFNSGPK